MSISASPSRLNRRTRPGSLNDLAMDERIVEKKIGSRVNASPEVSIVVPNYNTARYIGETLDSAFGQTFQNFELIVINDASPDSGELRQVLEPHFDRIVFIDKSANEGTSATRNLAVEHARAPVIAFLDADDIWFPTYLEELHAFMTEGGYEMAYADAETFISGREGKHYDFLQHNPPQGEVTRRMLIDGICHILPTGTLILKDVFEAAGGFDPGVRRTEDFDLWMRLLFRGVRIGYLRKILFRFRLSPGSGSGDTVVRIERSRDMWRILQRKLEFTEEENRVVERHIADTEAAIIRAKGRRAILQEDWAEARRMFGEASEMAAKLGLPLRHRLKLNAVRSVLAVSPRLLKTLYRSGRPGEVEFVEADDLRIP